MDYHDDVLVGLSDQLKHFMDLVGGQQNTGNIFDLLFRICIADESAIRDKALETVKTIVDSLDNELLEKFMFPFFVKLTKEVWSTCKSSGVALFADIYPRVNEEQKEKMRTIFCDKLVLDDSPLTRKASAMAMARIVSILEFEILKKDFIPVFHKFCADRMDSVSGHAARIGIALAERLSESDIDLHVFKEIQKLSEHPAWRVRHSIARCVGDLQKAIPHPRMRGKILSMVQRLSKDTEAEVRKALAKNIYSYCVSLKSSYEQSNGENNFEAVFDNSIQPLLNKLTSDSCTDVKLALAANVLNFGNILSDGKFVEHILPLIRTMLNEDQSLSLISVVLDNLSQLPKSVDCMTSLPMVKGVLRTLIIYSQSDWRTRRGLLVVLMYLARSTTRKCFTDNLRMFYTSLLNDPVYAVRRTATLILPLLSKQFSIDWFIDDIVPYFKIFAKDPRYLIRHIPLFCINELLNPSIASEEIENYLAYFEQTEDRRAFKALYKLKYTVNILRDKLEQQQFEEIIALAENNDYYKNENISLYTEETLTALQQFYDKNIFTYDIEQDDEWYLPGVLLAVYKYFLNIILQLFQDRTDNVKTRSIFTLNKIKLFTEEVYLKLDQSWVEDKIKRLTKPEIDLIEIEIEKILDKPEVENSSETEFMDITMSSTGTTASINTDLEHMEDMLMNTEEDGRDFKMDVDVPLMDELDENMLIKKFETKEKIKVEPIENLEENFIEDENIILRGETIGSTTIYPVLQNLNVKEAAKALKQIKSKSLESESPKELQAKMAETAKIIESGQIGATSIIPLNSSNQNKKKDSDDFEGQAGEPEKLSNLESHKVDVVTITPVIAHQASKITKKECLDTFFGSRPILKSRKNQTLAKADNKISSTAVKRENTFETPSTSKSVIVEPLTLKKGNIDSTRDIPSTSKGVIIDPSRNAPSTSRNIYIPSRYPPSKSQSCNVKAISETPSTSKNVDVPIANTPSTLQAVNMRDISEIPSSSKSVNIPCRNTHSTSKSLNVEAISETPSTSGSISETPSSSKSIVKEAVNVNEIPSTSKSVIAYVGTQTSIISKFEFAETADESSKHVSD